MYLPYRKKNRLEGCSYSEQGLYFITICTKDREEILGVVGDGVLDVPKVNLSKYGLIAEKHISRMQDFYKHIRIEYYVIMPNHIHMILNIMNNDCWKETNGTSRTPSPTNTVISKFISTFKRFCNKEYGENIWQRSYHDHIIRDQNEVDTYIEYIYNNPLKWLDDEC